MLQVTLDNCPVSVYVDPSKPRKRPNLVEGLASVPSTQLVQPFENQLTEVLAWLVDRADTFARRFAALFMPDGEAAEAVRSAAVVGASTQVRLPPLTGTGSPRPDLSVVGSDRSFELLVEVKVGAGFHDYTVGGETLTQTDAYIRAWREGTVAATEANVRRVGTLSLQTDLAHAPDSWRAADVLWEGVTALIAELVGGDGFSPETRAVAADLLDVLRLRVVPTGPAADLDDLLEWGRSLLKLVRPRLAARIKGSSESGNITRGRDSVSGNLLLMAPDGTEVRLWLGVTPRGGAYNGFGYDDSLWLAVLSAVPLAWHATLPGGGFERQRDPYGDNFFRVALPVEALRAESDDVDVQAMAALEWAYAALVGASLVLDPNAVGQERWRAFEQGDLNAFWAFVYDPPPALRFTWLPGDIEIVGMNKEEQLGVERVALLDAAQTAANVDDVARVRALIESFIAANPGDATAISAGLALVAAERALAEGAEDRAR